MNKYKTSTAAVLNISKFKLLVIIISEKMPQLKDIPYDMCDILMTNINCCKF